MKVKVEGEGEIEVPENSEVSSLVNKLGYHLDSVIVLENEEPLPIDSNLEDGMHLKIISVVSGG